MSIKSNSSSASKLVRGRERAIHSKEKKMLRNVVVYSDKLFIYVCFFTDAVSTSDHMASNGKMIMIRK
jgi:hypothetical protein